MAEMGMRLDNFKFEVDKNVIHLQTYGGERTHCLCALYVRDIFTEHITSTFQELNGNEYRVLQQVHKYDGEIAFRDLNWMNEKKDVTRHELSGWDFSICSNLEKTPLYKHPMTRDLMRGFGYICVATLPLAGYPYLCENVPYVIICHKILSKVKNPITKSVASSSSVKNVDYLKSLEADLKNDLSDFSKEKVVLRVGEETEIVNKAILCARSPVFAKMFRNGTTELKMNTVTITDIKMPVLRALVSFLCSGLVSKCDFKFLCDLYCAAVKYDIMELHQACIQLLLTKITLGNILDVLKLSWSQNNEFLKYVLIFLVSANFGTVALTPEWKKLMCDDPEIALTASAFFDQSTR